jgi:hypothetical protein
LRVRRVSFRRLSAPLAVALVLAGPGARANADPFIRDQNPQTTTDEHLVLDARFGRPGAEERLRARLALAGAKDPVAVSGWAFLCDLDYHRGRYRRADDDCTDAVAADPSDNNRATLAKVKLLREMPQPSLRGFGAYVPLDDFGQIRVRADKYAGPAVIDTGAQISVMMQSVADLAGVKLLGDTANVATTTKPVDGTLGVIPRVRIGSAELLDIPVLVMPDAQLTFEGGAVRLPFILGIHALQLFGRLAWLDHAKILELGDRALAPEGGAPLVHYADGFGVALDGPGGRRMAQLDTGSDATYLFDPGLDLVSPDERRALAKSTRAVGGVGGVVTEDVRRLPTASLELDNQPLALTNVVVSHNTADGEAARIGSDTIARYSRVTLDFGRMVLAVGK